MKQKLLAIAVIVLFGMKMHAQQQPSLTLHELIPGGKNFYNYYPKMPRNLTLWGEQAVHAKGNALHHLSSLAEASPLLTLDDLNAAFGKGAFKSLPAVRFPYADANVAEIVAGNGVFLYDVATKQRIAEWKVQGGAANMDFSNEGRMLAYTKGNNLYVLTADGRELAVSNEPNTGIVYGQSVHRNEFGIHKGTFWSPAGSLLAFYRMDETMVTDYPLVDAATRVASLKNIKYPMAGMKSHHVTVGVFHPQTEKIVYLKTGTPKDKYLTNIAWSADSKSIYVAEVNRGQDTMQMKRYDAQSGRLLATLFTETHPKYVEPEQPAIFVKGNDSQFLWLSRRDGYNHFYLYNTDGKLLKQITSGAWEVNKFVGFDEKGQHLFYTSNEASPIETHLYKVNMKTGKRTKLTADAGVHRVQLSPSGKTAVTAYSSLHNAGKVAVINTQKATFAVTYEAKNPFAKVNNMPQVELGSILANDGKTDLYYRLVKPSNFDTGKKYPVAVYVYGGPHSQMVDNSWMGQARGWEIYMAQKGYLVFVMDNRGTSHRGLEFENITHRRLGVIETQDQMSGVAFLKTLPYADTDRIGVHGWSFGGFMTLNLMLRHPETFKVGVAGGAVTDWKLYEVMYGERYMHSPKENADGYNETSMLLKAGNLKGRLLMIHDDMDDVVVPQHLSEFLRACVKAGTHPDVFVYPGHGHNVSGTDRVHLHEQITRYFDDFLK